MNAQDKVKIIARFYTLVSIAANDNSRIEAHGTSWVKRFVCREYDIRPDEFDSIRNDVNALEKISSN